MKRKIRLYPIILIPIIAGELILLTGCKKDEKQSKIEYGSETDIDGTKYTTVKIGNQWWMADNLKVTRYRDGSAIENVTDSAAWEILTTGAYCWYNNDKGYKAIWGGLYNWYAVKTGKLCPTGWHVPSNDEWTTLIEYLGGAFEAGRKMKNNEIGFPVALGGWRRDVSPWMFWYGGARGFWWSSTEDIGDFANWAFNVDFVSEPDAPYTSLEGGPGGGASLKYYGFSVRCVKDN